MPARSPWLKSGAYSSLNRLTIAGFGLVNFVVLIRTISKEEFGIWVLFISIATLSESIRRAFLYNSLIRHINIEEIGERGKVVTASLVLNVVSCFAVIVLLFLLRTLLSNVWKAPELSEMLAIYLIGHAFFSLTIHFNSIAESSSSFLGTFLSSLAQRVSFFTFIAYFFFSNSHLTLQRLAFLYTLAMILGAFVALLKGRDFHVRGKIHKVWILKHLKYGGYTFGTNLGSMIFKNTDSWMLGSIMSKVAVASYNPAIRISNLFEVPLGAISSVVFPNMVKRIKDNGLVEAKNLYEKSVAFSIAIIFPFVLMCIIFADPLIVLIAGKQYDDSAKILQVTMLYGLIVPFNRQFGITMNAIGKANINFAVLLVNTIVNIVLNFVLIKWIGVLGAAFATLCSYLLIFIVCEIILHQLIGVNLLRVGINILPSYRRIYNTLRDLNGKKKT